MTTLIIIQLILAVALVILVLLQGSDNEGLGLGGGTFGGMMSARGSANLLSRITATLFMVMSVVLTITASIGSEKNVLESLPSINNEESSQQEPSIPE